jgi:hypothetical protein
MKKSEYIVTFGTDKRESIQAFSAEEAKILAQAKQIKKGNDYIVTSILWRTKDGTYLEVR